MVQAVFGRIIVITLLCAFLARGYYAYTSSDIRVSACRNEDPGGTKK